MTEKKYRIEGLDCAEEINALRETVGRLNGVQDLRFDLLNSTMSVVFDGNGLNEDALIEGVRRAGLSIAGSGSGKPWADHGKVRLYSCIAGGVLLTLGFLSHLALHRSVVDALTGGAGLDAHQLPLPCLVLYLLSILCGGWFILPKAWVAMVSRRADMNLLMVVAVIGAAAIGEFFEAAVVTFLFSLSLVLESWSVGRARHAIAKLMELAPMTARYIRPGASELMEGPVADVPLGATALVRPGEKVPLDGVVCSGSSSVNEAPVTGESLPVSKGIGDTLFAGTINEDGALEFTVTRAADDSTVARIIHMVEEAQGRRARAEQWVEWFAARYTPAMIAIAMAVAILPPIFVGDWMRWFYQALVMLVIACPCALVLSTPVTVLAGLASAARSGVLIKGGAYLEQPARLDCIAVDKTGTITSGRPEVQFVVPFNGYTEAEVLCCAGSLESESGHPIAGAVVRAATQRKLSLKRTSDHRDMRGKGTESSIDGKRYWIGSHRLMHEMDAETEDIHASALAIEDAAHTLVALGSEDHVCGLIAVSDSVRDGAANMVQSLRNEGIDHIVMLTGDNRATAAAVSDVTGIDEFLAELLPEAKVSAIEKLIERFRHVAMVGDGVNDAPAMAASSLSIAMGAAGTDTAMETADIALMSDDLTRIPWLIRHSRRTLSIIKQNIFLALGVKAIFMALALAGLATLWMAIAADMGASLLVIFNGLRMLRIGK